MKTAQLIMVLPMFTEYRTVFQLGFCCERAGMIDWNLVTFSVQNISAQSKAHLHTGRTLVNSKK